MARHWSLTEVEILFLDLSPRNTPSPFFFFFFSANQRSPLGPFEGDEAPFSWCDTFSFHLPPPAQRSLAAAAQMVGVPRFPLSPRGWGFSFFLFSLAHGAGSCKRFLFFSFSLGRRGPSRISRMRAEATFSLFFSSFRQKRQFSFLFLPLNAILALRTADVLCRMISLPFLLPRNERSFPPPPTTLGASPSD